MNKLTVRWKENVETSLESVAIEEAAFAVGPHRLGLERSVWVAVLL